MTGSSGGSPRASARLDVQQMATDHVAHDGIPELVDPDRLVVGVDVPVQQQRRPEPPGQPVQGLESLVWRILAVTDTPRRRVREQHVHAAPVP
jgi:hypothetical protein